MSVEIAAVHHVDVKLNVKSLNFRCCRRFYFEFSLINCVSFVIYDWYFLLHNFHCRCDYIRKFSSASYGEKCDKFGYGRRRHRGHNHFPSDINQHSNSFGQQFEISSASTRLDNIQSTPTIIKLIQSTIITIRNHGFECEQIFWNRITSIPVKRIYTHNTNWFWLRTTPITAYPSKISNAMRKHQLIFWHKMDFGFDSFPDNNRPKKKNGNYFAKKRNKKIQINYKIINKQTSQPTD